MDNENKKTRREFLEDVLIKGSAAAVGGLVCIGLSPKVIGSNDSTRDLISTTKIDPEMILYDEYIEPVSTGFNESRNIAVDTSGVLYVFGGAPPQISVCGTGFGHCLCL